MFDGKKGSGYLGRIRVTELLFRSRVSVTGCTAAVSSPPEIDVNFAYDPCF